MALPSIDGNQVDAPQPFGMGEAERERVARDVVERHKRAKRNRTQRDLLAEKYLIHTDGEGDGQWADIWNGTAIRVPPKIGSATRLQRNLLRPMVENFVSYHTAIPFRALDLPIGDRRARDAARVNTALANHMIRSQNLNGIFAEAMGFAAVYGHCPVHAYWRWDYSRDGYDPLYVTEEEAAQYGGMRPGYVDFWVGDPWSTTYNEGATRRSVHKITYERTLPYDLVAAAFQHVPEVAAGKLRGNDRLPSAARYQRVIRAWSDPFASPHGSNVLDGGAGGEELVALVCEEVAAGIDPKYPRGRLRIVAVNGAATLDDRLGAKSSNGAALLLHDGPLPGGLFSAERVYSTTSFDDVLGKPYVADLDDLQVQLNQLVTLRVERLRRFIRSQLTAQAGSLEDDSLVTEDDAVLYYTGERPSFLEPPQADVGLEAAIKETQDQMFRIAGWQAASRGEGKAGDAAAKIVALAQADDSIHGPINRDFQAAVCRLLRVGHALHKQYQTLPMLVQQVGSDLGHLAQSWIEAKDLSETPPNYVLTQGYASPESRMQQLLSLVAARDGAGTPLMTADEFWEKCPDSELRPIGSEADRVRKSRPKQILAEIESAAAGMGEQQDPAQIAAIAAQLSQHFNTKYPILRTDDPQYHVSVYDEVVQDEQANPIARAIVRMRQDWYFSWMEQMAAMGAPPMQDPQRQAQGPGGGADASAFGPQQGGSSTSNQMLHAGAQVDQLTAQAQA